MSDEEVRLAAINAAALANAGRGLTSGQLILVAEGLLKYVKEGR